MKVYIAYDDGNLVGVFARCKDAKDVMTDEANGICTEHGRPGMSQTRWFVTKSGLERRIELHDPKRTTWEQWIDTHEVIK